MSSVKATAASRSGEMIYYEPLYAFNLKIFCVEILLWILASELRIQLQFLLKLSNAVLPQPRTLSNFGGQKYKNTSSMVDQILPGMRLRHPNGVQGQSPQSGGRGGGVRGRNPPEADDIMTFETPTVALFFTCFLSFLVINCDIKTVANRYYNES